MEPIVSWANGLPFTASGALAVEVGPVVNVQNGVPFTASGRVAITEAV